MTTTTKVALVTGAGSGIGRATALGLVRAGLSVVIAGRRKDKLEETVSLAGDDRTRMRAVPTNVADASSVKALFDFTRNEHGRLDLLFNNAGMNVPAVPMEDITVEQWQSVVDTNLTGVFLC